MPRRALDRAAFLAASAAAIAVPSIVRAADPLKIGLVAGDGAAPIYYAQQLGWFKNAGLDVDVQVLGNGAAIAAALSGGAIDFGSVNTGTLASARLRGLPLRAVFPVGIIGSAPIGDQLVVAKDGPIKTAADLAGKTIATNALGTMQHAGALSLIDARGGDAKAAKFVEIPSPAMGAAIDTGHVDAGIETEPFTTLTAPVTRSLGPLYDGMRKPFIILAMCATEPWLQKNPGVAATFASVVRQANIWANAPQNDKQRRQYNADLTKVDIAVIDKVKLQEMGTTIDAGLMQPPIDAMVKYGFLAQPVNPNDLVWKA